MCLHMQVELNTYAAKMALAFLLPVHNLHVSWNICSNIAVWTLPAPSSLTAALAVTVHALLQTLCLWTVQLCLSRFQHISRAAVCWSASTVCGTSVESVRLWNQHRDACMNIHQCSCVYVCCVFKVGGSHVAPGAVGHVTRVTSHDSYAYALCIYAGSMHCRTGSVSP